MKLLTCVFLVLLFFNSNNDKIFDENIIVHDINSKEFNIRDLKITKDTVMVMIWCKTCGSCIKRLNSLKNINNRQILAIASTENGTIEKEKAIIAKNNWTYDLFFDTEQNFVKFLIQKKYLTQYEKVGNKYRFFYPQIFMFVNNKFVCNSCDDFLP